MDTDVIAFLAAGAVALLDDIAGLVKVGAASIDDVIGQTGRASAKALGVVVDDAAVTPQYANGFAASRELPIVGRIALGSVRNKMLFLMPAALALSALLPEAIMPLLMVGGAYLCFEAAEKILEPLLHRGHAAEEDAVQGDPATMERERVRGAIRTDMVLSAEIMAITLATVSAETSSLWNQAVVLAAVGLIITAAVYGTVAVIVKADDVGLFLTRRFRNPLARGVGVALVRGMPLFLSLLGVVGTLAMLWVGGGIVVHGLASLGATGVEHAVEAVAHAVGGAVPESLSGALSWVATAVGGGLFGLALGSALALLVFAAHAVLPKKAESEVEHAVETVVDAVVDASDPGPDAAAPEAAPRYVIDAALTHDSLKDGGEPGYYVVDLHAAEPYDDVIARFLREARAKEYCDVMNARWRSGRDGARETA